MVWGNTDEARRQGLRRQAEGLLSMRVTTSKFVTTSPRLNAQGYIILCPAHHATSRPPRALLDRYVLAFALLSNRCKTPEKLTIQKIATKKKNNKKKKSSKSLRSNGEATKARDDEAPVENGDDEGVEEVESAVVRVTPVHYWIASSRSNY